MNPIPNLLQTLGNSPRGRRLVGVLATGILAASIVGCYGRFPLTNAIYKWNGRVTNNHVVNSIIMIVLAIFPVYWLSILIDAIIINSIEFWDGSRVDVARTYQQPDGTTVTLAPGDADNEAVLTVSNGDTITARRTFIRDAHGSTTVLDEQCEVVSHVTPDGRGGFAFTDAMGKPTGSLSADEIADLRAGGTRKELLAGAGI